MRGNSVRGPWPAERVDPPRRLFGASRRLLEPLPGVVVPRQPKHVERPAFHRGVVRALELELKWYVVDANLVAGGTSASSRMPASMLRRSRLIHRHRQLLWIARREQHRLPGAALSEDGDVLFPDAGVLRHAENLAQEYNRRGEGGSHVVPAADRDGDTADGKAQESRRAGTPRVGGELLRTFGIGAGFSRSAPRRTSWLGMASAASRRRGAARVRRGCGTRSPGWGKP